MSEPAVPGAGTSRPVALVDLLDRVLARGVVVSGELALSIADVDLVYISLRALLSSVRAQPAQRSEEGAWE
ncbi:gas vesicle protein [Phytohabitans kaempferiae]|uniref:Gas vesicle protein n=1 Tax=Phytohabitans kaempferiae TaxID=1620943 RepID=A0ABV6MGE3_9ACTN